MNQQSAEQVVQAIENENVHERVDIADAVGLHENHVGKLLREMVDAGMLYREKDGYTYEYFVAQADNGDSDPAPATGSAGDATGDYKAPVNRDYNFADAVPDTEDVYEYIPTNGEWDKLEAIVANRAEMGTLPRVLVSGPSGNGKTTAAEWLAAKNEMAFYEVSLSNAVYEADLLGTTNVVGDETVWEDGPITRALLSSAVRPTVLLIDEANRALPEVANVLMPVLDHRCRVVLTGGRGGETIRGDPRNLIVIGTINEGREYHGTSDMDHAVKRRFKFKFPTDYLGRAHPARERDLIVDRTPAHEGLAELMVEGANDIRDLADDADTKVHAGLPTAALLDWAGGAFAYAKAGIGDPVDEAARDVARLYYGDGPEADKVETLMLAPLGGAPFDEDEFERWAGERGSQLECDECSWTAYEDDAPEGALDFMECPDCGGVLSWKK